MVNTLAHLKPTAVARIKVVVFLLCLYPLARLVLYAFTGKLGVNPIEFITRSTGTWTLAFLMITLAVTPLRKLSGWNWLLRFRRMFGLYVYFYAVLHFTTYIWFDQSFDVAAVIKDIYKRPFITIGFAALVLLTPLAITSTNGMVKRLGAARWQLLHKLVYVIGILGVIHYWWLVKRDLTQPIIYACVLALLLGARLVLRKKSTA